jgi:preprotein translocase subunit YajC
MFNFLYNSVLNLGQVALAQAAEGVAQAAPAAQQAPGWMQFVPFAVIIGVFYFFLIRPQAKKQRETQSFLSALKVGDQVITQSGILGRIAGMNEQVVTLEVANNVQIKVLRSLVMMSQASLQTKKEEK